MTQRPALQRPAPQRVQDRRIPKKIIVGLLIGLLIGGLAWVFGPRLFDSVGVGDQKVDATRGSLPALTAEPKPQWKLALSEVAENSTGEATVIDPKAEGLLLVVFPGDQGVVGAVDAKGTVRWRTKLPKLTACADSLIGPELICAADGKIQSLTISSGAVKAGSAVAADVKDLAVQGSAFYTVSYTVGAQGSPLEVKFAKYQEQQVWETPLTLAANSPRPYLNYRFTDGLLAPGSVDSAGKPIVLSLSDGARAPVGSAVSASVLANGDLALATDRNVEVLAGTGKKRFATRGAEQVLATWDQSPADLPQLFALDESGQLSLTGLSNQGRTKWSLPGYIDALSYCSGKLLAWGADHDTVGAIDAKTGLISWQAGVSKGSATPLLCAGPVAVLEMPSAGQHSFVGLDLETGNPAWTVTPDQPDWVMLSSSLGLLVANRDGLTLYR